MKTRFLLVVSLFLWVCVLLQAEPRAIGRQPGRAVAVTIDDLPATDDVRVAEINRKLLASFARHRIPVVGFVNEGKLHVGREMEARIGLLRSWLDAGYELGNHTYSHIAIGNATLAEYKEDVIRGEAAIRRLMREKGQTLRYFRHPQLRTGQTAEYERELNAFLAERGYTVAPVTIDNQEWIFAAGYAAARKRGDARNAERIARAYVPYLEECFAFFEGLSQETLGYEVKQTLLLHANEINADHFDEVAAMMKRRGYRFVTLADALADPAYRLPTKFMPRGESWLHRWRAARELPLRAEPREPPWLSRLLDSYR